MPASAQGDLNQESRKVVLRMIDAYNARDLEGLVELCDQAVEVRSYFTSAIGGGEYGGHHGIKQFLRDVSEAWEHLTATVGELLPLGDGRILALGALRG